MTLTKENVEQLAPDQASLGAALKLMKPASWPMLARSANAALLWGECQGSGAMPYRVVVSIDDLGYKCTCPSRKFPCKHVLAVMWMHCERPECFAPGPSPDWVADWLSRRRTRTAAPPAAEAKGTSIAAALEPTLREKPADPRAIAHAGAQRKRLRDEREAAVIAGLDELDRWIVDQLNLGLATFAQRAAQSAKTLCSRLVDAKAQGLAGRVEALVADTFRVPDQMRAGLVFERLAALALISSAYRRQDRLPPELKADVRRVAGWALRREELLADAEASRMTGDWLVAATRSEIQPDKLRRLETWLLQAAPAAGTPAVALVVDFVPVSAGPATSPFIAGEVFTGEVVFYPSASPLRGQLAARTAPCTPINWPLLPDGLEAALTAYEAALCRQPWLDFWPLGAGALHLERLPDRQIARADAAGWALPLNPAQSEALTPMLGLAQLSALFTWDGVFATLLAAETPVGHWHEGLNA